MSPVKLSIIVPVYNAEAHLASCLSSLLAQSLQSIEIICVNDDSTDRSSDLLNTYSQKDPRIIPIHLTSRKGAGYARNKGLSAARGKFIGFVDADDMVSDNMFHDLYDAALSHKAPVALCFPQCFDDQTHLPVEVYYFRQAEQKLALSAGGQVYDKSEIASALPHIPVVPWNKIYLTELVRSCNAHFAEGMLHEDFLFFHYIMLHSPRLVLFRERWYKYRVNRQSSVTTSFNLELFRDIERIFCLLEQQLPELMSSPDLKQPYRLFKIRHLIAWTNQLLRSDSGTAVKKKYFNLITKSSVNLPLYPSLSLIEKLQYLFIQKKKYRLFRLKIWADSKISGVKRIL